MGNVNKKIGVSIFTDLLKILSSLKHPVFLANRNNETAETTKRILTAVWGLKRSNNFFYCLDPFYRGRMTIMKEAIPWMRI